MATAEGAWVFFFLFSLADPRRVAQSHGDLLALLLSLFDKVLVAPTELEVA